MARVVINKWDRNILNDPRIPLENGCRMCTNFDSLTNAHKLTPYRDSEDGDINSSTSQKQNFAIALWTPTSSYRLFSLGVKSGAATAEVLMKTLGTGGAGDLSDNTWLTPSNNQGTTGSTSFDLFIYYKQTGKIYGARGGTQIWAFTADGATGFDDSSQALVYTTIGQGLVHSKDDVLYVPYDNKIASKNGGGAWSTAALTLPTSLYITSISEYGNFLKIECAPLSGVGKSVSYLWDRDSSLTTLSESMEVGDDNVMIGETLGSTGVTIALSGGNGTRFKDRVTFRFYGTGEQPIILEGTTGTLLSKRKQKINDRLYFMMSITLNGVLRTGTWSIGKNADGIFTIVHERTLDNNTTPVSSDTLGGFIFVGDFLFQSYNVAATGWLVRKTNDQASYTATSIRETLINPHMVEEEKSLQKKLNYVGATYEPIPTGGSASVRYRMNGGSWKLLFTETTVGATRTKPVTKDAESTRAFLSDGSEVEFRLESTGGVVFTGLEYDYTPI